MRMRSQTSIVESEQPISESSTDATTPAHMPTVLIIEDNCTLLSSLGRGLREEGYSVLAVASITAAQQAIDSGGVDVLVLDLMLPDCDGLDWLRLHRMQGFAKPVVIITARDTVADRVQGLDGGADDYLVKPFSFEELLARLRAVLRRTHSESERQLQVGDLTLDVLHRSVLRAGCVLELTQRQFELLIYLMRTTGQVVTREMIAENVWKDSSATWTNVIEVQINHLRRKIESPAWPPILHTVRGEGYVLEVRP